MNDLPLLPDPEGNPHSISLDTIMGGPDSKPGTHCVTPDGYPYTTSYPTCPEPIAATPPPRPVRELPHTGAGSIDLILLAVALVLAGLLLRTVSAPVTTPAIPPVVTPAS